MFCNVTMINSDQFESDLLPKNFYCVVHFTGATIKMAWKMAVALLVTNASCLYISVLKCGMMKPDESFVLGAYSKWKDRFIDKGGIEYYNLLTSVA